MTRLGAVLLVALVLSGLWLVRVSYESRRLFSAIEKARAEERALAVDRQRLQADLRALATPIRVERTAREKLAMRQATPAVTHYATLPPTAPAAAPELDPASPVLPTTTRAPAAVSPDPAPTESPATRLAARTAALHTGATR